jgi:hypothetical protein
MRTGHERAKDCRSTGRICARFWRQCRGGGTSRSWPTSRRASTGQETCGRPSTGKSATRLAGRCSSLRAVGWRARDMWLTGRSPAFHGRAGTGCSRVGSDCSMRSGGCTAGVHQATPPMGDARRKASPDVYGRDSPVLQLPSYRRFPVGTLSVPVRRNTAMVSMPPFTAPPLRQARCPRCRPARRPGTRLARR